MTKRILIAKLNHIVPVPPKAIYRKDGDFEFPVELDAPVPFSVKERLVEKEDRDDRGLKEVFRKKGYTKAKEAKSEKVDLRTR